MRERKAAVFMIIFQILTFNNKTDVIPLFNPFIILALLYFYLI